MENDVLDKTIPLRSMLIRPEEEQRQILEESFVVPRSIKSMLASRSTGAYIKGLIKNHHLPQSKAPLIAFALLQIALGRKKLPQLAGLLSSDIQVPNDKAQAIAEEIEKDLFAPIALDLNKHLAKIKESAKHNPPIEGVGNIVNLKDIPNPNKKFPLPPRK